jgi:hypothetical protein
VPPSVPGMPARKPQPQLRPSPLQVRAVILSLTCHAVSFHNS